MRILADLEEHGSVRLIDELNTVIGRVPLEARFEGHLRRNYLEVGNEGQG